MGVSYQIVSIHLIYNNENRGNSTFEFYNSVDGKSDVIRIILCSCR